MSTKKENVCINKDIRADKIRLIAEDGEQLGIFSRYDALKIAEEQSLDLVQMTLTKEGAVCRLMDHGKHLYDKKKKVQGQRKKQRQKRVSLKEIKFTPNTDVGDYNIKLNKIRKFLEDGNKVKVSIRFRGREMMHQNLGVALLNRVENDLADVCVIEQPFKLEGRQILMILASKP